MLQKKDIIQKLNQLVLDPKQYCVMTGAAMVLHGIKQQTQDIDIGCSDEVYEELQHRGFKVDRSKKFECIEIDGCIEIFRNWTAEKKVYVEDIPIADIYSIRQYKQELSREKDLLDLALIDEFLKQQK